MNIATLKIAGQQLRQTITNPYILCFSLGLPLLMYFIYGSATSYGSYSVGRGNVAAQILLQMTAYGVIYATSSLAVNISLERESGWLRQLALTRLGLVRYLLAKLISIVAVSVAVIVLLFAMSQTGVAAMDSIGLWVRCGLVALIPAVIGILLGLAVGLTVRTNSVSGLLAGAVVVGSFASGLFTPLDQMGTVFQNIGHYMPFYGVNRLLIGQLAPSDTTHMLPEQIMPITAWDFVSTGVWCGIFALIAWIGLRRSTNR